MVSKTVCLVPNAQELLQSLNSLPVKPGTAAE